MIIGMFSNLSKIILFLVSKWYFVYVDRKYSCSSFIGHFYGYLQKFIDILLVLEILWTSHSATG